MLGSAAQTRRPNRGPLPPREQTLPRALLLPRQAATAAAWPKDGYSDGAPRRAAALGSSSKSPRRRSLVRADCGSRCLSIGPESSPQGRVVLGTNCATSACVCEYLLSLLDRWSRRLRVRVKSVEVV